MRLISDRNHLENGKFSVCILQYRSNGSNGFETHKLTGKMVVNGQPSESKSEIFDLNVLEFYLLFLIISWFSGATSLTCQIRITNCFSIRFSSAPVHADVDRGRMINVVVITISTNDSALFFLFYCIGTQFGENCAERKRSIIHHGSWLSTKLYVSACLCQMFPLTQHKTTTNNNNKMGEM